MIFSWSFLSGRDLHVLPVAGAFECKLSVNTGPQSLLYGKTGEMVQRSEKLSAASSNQPHYRWK
jgi:hypothetical protein